MKNTHTRLISGIASAALAVSTLGIQPLSTAAGEYTPPEEVYQSQIMDEDDVRELLELAFSLGALDDHLEIANHTPVAGDTEPEEALRWLIDNANNTELTSSLMPLLSGGVCLGISVLEVLVHNGVISPSDIVEGAENLSDIQRSERTDNVVAAYHALQTFYELDYTMHSAPTNMTFAEQIDDLIATSEKCMAENRYFLISYHTNKGGHAVVGIGITDGSWEFDGVTYDKCILTLDSNAKTQDGTPVPYAPSSNIYINTIEHTLTIPAYKNDDNMNNIMMICAIDDDSVLNYRGMINPSDTTSCDFTDTVALGLGFEGIKTDYEVLVREKDGTEHKLEKTENNYVQKMSFLYYLEGDEFEISAKGKPGWSPLDSRVIIKDLGKTLFLNIRKDNADYVIRDNYFSIDAVNNRHTEYGVELTLNEGYYPFSPYYYWDLNGFINDNAEFQIADKGLIISGDGMVETCLGVGKPYLDENGEKTGMYLFEDSTKFTSVGSVYAQVSETGGITMKIDPDHDGVYDTEVEKGDVNCDGLKDGADASLILYNNAQQVDDWET